MIIKYLLIREKTERNEIIIIEDSNHSNYSNQFILSLSFTVPYIYFYLYITDVVSY